VAATVEELLSGCRTVLDVGCGYGRIALRLLERGFDLYGVDLSSRLIGELKRTVPGKLRSQFRVANMCQLPFREDRFDAVLCLWSAFSELLYVGEQVLALKEMNRVLKRGGICFVEIAPYHRPTVSELARGVYRGHGKRIRKDVLFGLPHYHYNHDRGSLGKALSRAGIQTGRIRTMTLAGRSRQTFSFHKVQQGRRRPKRDR
jgi:ubiquinone/menaquinone biosynthesis C-methylase UbiE